MKVLKMTPERLKEIRLEFGMTLRQFATFTGYSFTGIGKMEQGLMVISERMIKNMKSRLKKKASNLKKVVDSI